MQSRLAEVYRRVSRLPRHHDATSSFAQFCAVLDQVEDELSGVPQQTPPPPDEGGRMYCPLPDRLTRRRDGGFAARTTGHMINVGPDGAVEVVNLRAGRVEFRR